ncbi:MAG: NAD(+) synthase, partial [Verrucomicrobia bacterium]|nr:NAD(+) synthase [Verrucomicrobiota bacterium]
MKVGLLQLNSTVGDFDGNVTRLLAGYLEACAQGAELVVAPEMFLCGYPPRDLLLRTDFIHRNLAALEIAASQVGEIPLCVGFVDWNLERPGKPLFNSAALLRSGKVEQKFQKALLPTYDVFDEARYFEPGKAGSTFMVSGCRVGLTICEDIWNDADFWPERLYRRDPVKELVEQGVDLLVNLSASPWHQGKERTRLAMLQRVASDEGVPLVQVNMVGGNDELIFDGQSVVIDGEGRCLHWGRGFREEVAVIDTSGKGGAYEVEIPEREAQFYQALSLGIRDYVQKCGFKSVLCGLSGGIDSALTAVLAVEALGASNVMGVAMPSRYSSEGSWNDAKVLANRLGIRFEVLPIEPAFKLIEEGLAGVFAGRVRNEAEENIQSRLRGLTLMALSNKFGSLV